MSKTFADMKTTEYRAKVFEQIRHAALEEIRTSRYGRAAAFVQTALRSIGDYKTADKIKDCQRGQYCGYLYCGVCRKRHAEKMFRRVLERGTAEAVENIGSGASVRWTTILDDLVMADSDAVSKAVAAARRRYVNFSRKWTDTWATGVIELELVDMQRVQNMIGQNGNSSRKRDVLLSMGGGDTNYEWIDGGNNKRRDYVLIHSHLVMGSNTHRWDEISDDARGRWKGSYRVRFDRLRENGTFEQNVQKMSSYCYKNRMAYNYEFGNYEWEDEIEDQNQFSIREFNTLFNLVDMVMGENRKGLVLGWNTK